MIIAKSKNMIPEDSILLLDDCCAVVVFPYQVSGVVVGDLCQGVWAIFWYFLWTLNILLFILNLLLFLFSSPSVNYLLVALVCYGFVHARYDWYKEKNQSQRSLFHSRN